jgi:hypothetical protein
MLTLVGKEEVVSSILPAAPACNRISTRGKSMRSGTAWAKFASNGRSHAADIRGYNEHFSVEEEIAEQRRQTWFDPEREH